MQSLGSIPITPGETLTISPAKYTSNPVKGVALFNGSGYWLTVLANGNEQTIPPGINDFVPLPVNTTNLSVQVLVDTINHNPGIPTPELQGNIYEINDPIASSYPCPNPAFQNVGNLPQSVLLSSSVQTEGANIPIFIPQGVLSISVLVTKTLAVPPVELVPGTYLVVCDAGVGQFGRGDISRSFHPAGQASFGACSPGVIDVQSNTSANVSYFVITGTTGATVTIVGYPYPAAMVKSMMPELLGTYVATVHHTGGAANGTLLAAPVFNNTTGQVGWLLQDIGFTPDPGASTPVVGSFLDITTSVNGDRLASRTAMNTASELNLQRTLGYPIQEGLLWNANTPAGLTAQFYARYTPVVLL